MRVDKGVALLVYREHQNQKEYLVLKRDKNWEGWEIPKGHLENDSYVGTVYLELNEEAGIAPVEIQKILPLHRNLTFQFEENGEKVVSDFRCFEVKVDSEVDIDLSQNPSEEHDDFKWLTRSSAKNKLEYPEQKNLI